MSKGEQEQIKKLRAKVRDLEIMVKSQQKLIEIMKRMPGVSEVKIENEDKKSKVHSRPQKRGGSVAECSSTREPGESSTDFKCDDENIKVMENREL